MKYIVIILALLGLLFFAVGYANSRATERNYSEAAIVRAQAESRLTTATAGAITSVALLPWGVLGIVGVLGLAVTALAGSIVHSTLMRNKHIIERQVIYLPAPGQSRAQVWAGVSNVAQLGAGGDAISVEMSQPARCIEVVR